MNEKKYDELFQADLLHGAELIGPYEFPRIKATSSIPETVVPFDKAISGKNTTSWVHFFEDDFAFQRYLNRPFKYLEAFINHPGIYSPDCSVLVNLPLFKQIESIGKSRMLGSLAQRIGFDVIPTVRWGLAESYSFAFESLDPGGTKAIGSIGCSKNPELKHIFNSGIPEMLVRLQPETVILHGPYHEESLYPILEANIPIICFPSETTLAKEAKYGGSRTNIAC